MARSDSRWQDETAKYLLGTWTRFAMLLQRGLGLDFHPIPCRDLGGGPSLWRCSWTCLGRSGLVHAWWWSRYRLCGRTNDAAPDLSFNYVTQKLLTCRHLLNIRTIKIWCDTVYTFDISVAKIIVKDIWLLNYEVKKKGSARVFYSRSLKRERLHRSQRITLIRILKTSHSRHSSL